MSEQQGTEAPAPAWFGGEKSDPAVVEPTVEVTPAETEIPIELEPEVIEADAATKAAAGVAEVDGGDHYLKLPQPKTALAAPPWAKVPPAPFRFPRGVEVAFVRIRGELTAARQKGDRVLIIWGLSDGDEKLAVMRSMSDSNRVITEMAKQTIRAVDGHPADWTGKPGPGNIDQVWRELGGKGRGQIVRLYTQLHVFDAAEQADFFENCVALVATG